jgi:hypothetical protein
LGRFQVAIKALEMHAEIMFPAWNKTADIQVLIACAVLRHLSRSVTLQKEDGDSRAERVLCAAVGEA